MCTDGYRQAAVGLPVAYGPVGDRPRDVCVPGLHGVEIDRPFGPRGLDTHSVLPRRLRLLTATREAHGHLGGICHRTRGAHPHAAILWGHVVGRQEGRMAPLRFAEARTGGLRAIIGSGRREPVGFHPLQKLLRDGIARLQANDGIDAALENRTQRCLAYALPFVSPFLDCCRWKDRTAIEAATVLACHQFLAVVTGMPMCANVIWRYHRILVYRTSLAVKASSNFLELRACELLRTPPSTHSSEQGQNEVPDAARFTLNICVVST
jgi:hypothetical protein